MKKINVYLITEEQFLNTEYRPLDIEIEAIETEDNWDFQDAAENVDNTMQVEKVVECNDLMVFKVTTDSVQYVVQLK